MLASLPSSAESPQRAGSGSGAGGAGMAWPGGSTMLASMSFGMSRASRAVLDALSHAARHAPPRRPSIIRPSQMSRRAGRAAGASGSAGRAAQESKQ